jgi:hypothetical protein
VTLIFSPGCKFGDADAASLISVLSSSGVATPRLSTLAQLAKLEQNNIAAPRGLDIFARNSPSPQ